MKKFFISIVLGFAAFLVVGCGTDGDVLQKDKINGPPERPKTEMNILVIGESTAANFGLGLTYEAHHNVLEMNIDHRFMKAKTPNESQYASLATGQDSSWLSYYGDLVFDRTEDYETIRFVNLSVYEYTMNMWTPTYTTPGCLIAQNESEGTMDPAPNCFVAGPYGETMQNNRFAYIANVKKWMTNLGYKFTHVIVDVGRADAKAETSKENYIRSFNSFKQGLRDLGIDAKIILTRVSYADGKSNPEIIAAQDEIINRNDDVYPGPNLDMIGEEYRYDGVNFNKDGLIKAATLYNEFVR